MESDVDDLKELLPLAARACGLVASPAQFTPPDRDVFYYIDGEGCVRRWRPHESPGDGAEMEDKLRISVWRFEDCVSCAATLRNDDDHEFEELYADHPDEGTARRWASLRVAAAIGRAMK
jgi:hypothetical protein